MTVVKHKKPDRWWRFRRLTLSRVAESLHDQNLEIVFATSRDQYAEAFRLAHQRYLEAGIISPQPHGFWLTPYHILNDTRVVMAYLDGRPSCTASIVFDSACGLPSDDIYRPELDVLRREGRRLAEFCSLAALPALPARNTLFAVYRFLFRYAVSRGCTDIIISIRPKHADFYTRILLFEEYGPLRSYPKFVDVQAILQRLEIAVATERLRRAYRDFPDEINLYKFFITESIGDQEKQFALAGALPKDDLDYFLARSCLWEKMPPAFQDYCRRQYGLQGA
ncbi:MAG: hypothetical protein JRJ56_08275 [Deltaproteobacteria bacterium]|nr:hypothetical protein [Deltaproteobacteria bacterium]